MEMKNIWAILMLLGITYSCDDFLERSAQNLIVPETVEHYKELLQGEAYFKDLFPDFVNAYPKNHQRIEVRYVDAVS